MELIILKNTEILMQKSQHSKDTHLILHKLPRLNKAFRIHSASKPKMSKMIDNDTILPCHNRNMSTGGKTKKTSVTE